MVFRGGLNIGAFISTNPPFPPLRLIRWHSQYQQWLSSPAETNGVSHFGQITLGPGGVGKSSDFSSTLAPEGMGVDMPQPIFDFC